MRQIKFRGQRTDTKEWVYGYYLKATASQLGEDIPLASARICHCIIQDGIKFYVIPESVGQFTGLLDKQGKEIYEGDIVTFDRNDRLSFILWSQSWCGFAMYEHQDKLGMKLNMFVNMDKFEIIGNIHENKELMEE